MEVVSRCGPLGDAEERAPGDSNTLPAQEARLGTSRGEKQSEQAQKFGGGGYFGGWNRVFSFLGNAFGYHFCAGWSLKDARYKLGAGLGKPRT